MTTLGTVGWRKLQETILFKFGISIEQQPLRTFLERHYGSGSAGSTSLHNKAMTAASAIGGDGVVDTVRPIYAKLRGLFLQTPGAIENLVSVLRKCTIAISSPEHEQLYIRMQWEIEADNEFTMAMGVDTAQQTQNPVMGTQNSVQGTEIAGLGTQN